MTIVLHTHSRKLDLHPHIHVIVPGGGIDKRRRPWKKKKSQYPFNHKNLVKVFRAQFLTALNEAKLPIPYGVPHEWVVVCTNAGKGISAIKDLSRYLYRGAISEKNIVSNQNGEIVFEYTESGTIITWYRTLKGEDFLKLFMQHVLPRKFRRVRDYRFLHGNAKKILHLVQLVLHVKIDKIKPRTRPFFKCPCCKSPMTVVGYRFCSFNPG